MKLGNGHFSNERCGEGILPFCEGEHCGKQGSGVIWLLQAAVGPRRPGLRRLRPFTMAGKSPAHTVALLTDL